MKKRINLNEYVEIWKTASGNICITLDVKGLDFNPDFDLGYAMEELKKGKMSLCVSIPNKTFKELVKETK